MLREFTLQPDQETKVQVEGKFLVITKSSGPVELVIGGTTPIIVDLHDRIHLRGDSPSDRAILIKNISGGVNNFEIHTSDLLVDKRQATDVPDSIQVAPNQRIGIDPDVNIVQSIIQNPVRIDANNNTVRILADEIIGIDPNSNTVQAFIQNPVHIDADNNTVRIQADEIIGIDPNSNTVQAFIQNPIQIDTDNNTVRIGADEIIGIDPNSNTVNAILQDPVTVAVDQLIGIDPAANTVQASILNPISIAADQLVCIDPACNEVDITKHDVQYQSLDTVTIASNTGNVAANAARDQLLLTADPANTDPIWLGDATDKGLPLLPGDKQMLDSNQALTLTGTDGDRLFVAELVRV